MYNTSLLKKIFLTVSSLFIFFVLLEIVMRLSGGIILFLREYSNSPAFKEKGAYRILCLGESTTASGGANSYPSQLEKILNQRNIGIKFSVINAGLESIDSAFILSKLSENVNKFRPNMVITMIGLNDGPETMKYENAMPIKDAFSLRKFRVYKLAQYLALSIINKFKDSRIGQMPYKINNDKSKEKTKEVREGNKYSNDQEQFWLDYLIYKNERNFEKAEEVLKKALILYPEDFRIYVKLGDIYILQKKFQEAEKTLKIAITINSYNPSAYCILAWCYTDQQRYADAEEVLNKALEFAPKEIWVYDELYNSYRKQGKVREIEALCEKVAKMYPEYDKLAGLVATAYREIGRSKEVEEYYEKANRIRLRYYNPVTRHNYQKIKEIVSERGIRLVCVQYAMRNVEALEKLFDSTKGIVFVDNEKVFKEALKYGKYEDYFTDNFGGDFGHCTPKGNSLLAENIADVLIKRVFNK